MHQVILALPKVYSLASCSSKNSVWTTVFSPGACCVCVCLVVHSCPTLCSQSSFVSGNSPGKNTRVGCHALLQGIFPNQGSNPSLPHSRQILYHMSHQFLLNAKANCKERHFSLWKDRWDIWWKGRHECLSGECGGSLIKHTGKGPIFFNYLDDGMENLLLKSVMTLNWIGWLAIWK